MLFFTIIVYIKNVAKDYIYKATGGSYAAQF